MNMSIYSALKSQFDKSAVKVTIQKKRKINSSTTEQITQSQQKPREKVTPLAEKIKNNKSVLGFFFLILVHPD